MTDTWSMPAGSGDRWPEDYERGRPGWPPEVVDLPGVPPTATVLDLGAGTGKLTRLLVAAFDRVLAVEPADAMRRLLETLCPEAETLPGTVRGFRSATPRSTPSSPPKHSTGSMTSARSPRSPASCAPAAHWF